MTYTQPLHQELIKLYGVRNQILREHGFNSYGEYLGSQWHGHMYRYVMARDKRTCRICGQGANQIHHLRYTEETLFSTPRGHGLVPDVVALCQSCHEAVHFSDDGSMVGDFEERARALMFLMSELEGGL